MLQRIETEELRAFCDCPSRYQLLDLTGVALGSFFMMDGLRRFKKPGEQPWASIGVALGGFMVWVHSRRFVAGSELGTRWES